MARQAKSGFSGMAPLARERLEQYFMTTKRMLVDASHPEETRIVITSGNQLDEFDFEAANKRQLRGNIYLAKVTRVEPSLQAAFVEYGGNRHGFLAFSEIHPDYYQIPKADREALLRAEEEIVRQQAKLEAQIEASAEAFAAKNKNTDEEDSSDPESTQNSEINVEGEAGETTNVSVEEPTGEQADTNAEANGDDVAPTAETSDAKDNGGDASGSEGDSDPDADNATGDDFEVVDAQNLDDDSDIIDDIGPGQDALLELRRAQARRYKIQEVIKRRQVLLIQVVKEERGNKGAALTTYLSLAGRYSVLMPNTARGGGISRKITSGSDRKRLKQIASELSVPAGMGVILRTAGATRTKAEIKRDFEYLSRLWENVRKLTLHSSAPSLVYEEGSLIKRTIRDLYNKDISEVLVAGDDAYREAKDFMQLIMPSHAKNVKLYKEAQHLFSRYDVETQLDAIFSPQVTLPSGGYIVINPTEALVSIDVNSGRATKEQNIEATALQTNLEAAEEAARQFRLRDLAGLIVIDFIDMNDRRSTRAVEKRLKDSLKNDRARIQIGRISHFGLLEMSRQRMRSGVLESSTNICPTCEGTGIIRAVESRALMVMRAMEDHVVRKPGASIEVKTPTEVALYILNTKRATLMELEANNRVSITISSDIGKTASEFSISKGEDRLELAPAVSKSIRVDSEQPEPIEPEVVSDNDNLPKDNQSRESQPKRKRRRRKSSVSQTNSPQVTSDTENQAAGEAETKNADTDQGTTNSEVGTSEDGSEDQPRKRRRRGRRGGRRNKRNNIDDSAAPEANDGVTANNDTSDQASVNSNQSSDVDNSAVSESNSDDNTPGEGNQLPQTKASASSSSSAKSNDISDKQATDDIEGKSEKEKKPARRRSRKKVDSKVKANDKQEDKKAASPKTSSPKSLDSESEVKDADKKTANVVAQNESKPAKPVAKAKKPKKDIPKEGVIISTSNTEAAVSPQRKGWWSRG